MRLGPLATTVLVAAAIAGMVRADEVTMVNGDRLTGKVLHKDPDVLAFRTDYAGELRLRCADIAVIVTDDPVDLVLDDGTTVRMPLGGPAPSETGAPAPELARIRYINPTPEESGTGYRTTGRATLALSQTHGNTSNELYHGDGELVLRTKTHRLTFGGDGNYGRDSGVTSAQNWRAKTRYDHFFAPREFLYAKASLEKDIFKDIRRRRTTGAGYGYQLYEDDTTTFSVRGGLDYVAVSHYDTDYEDYAALGWGVDLRHRLTVTPGELFHVEEGTRGIGNQRGTVVQTKTGLRLPLSEQFNITAQVNVDWESRPAPDRKNTDTTLMLGLGYAFN